MAKKIKGVKVPKTLMGRKLRKGTRKDIAELVRAVGHPDAKSLLAAASAAIVPILAAKVTDRMVHKSGPKPNVTN